ncbi:hypothetical protein KC480_05540 [Bacillus velezensis]|uniref:hypothetical protein n=1 Tax=Bacillus velezensis TaxID=492670 RepID=UPI001E3CBCCB|nr:hypothetical protein [Bacillus velezensis]MCD7910986.1 hypothetical protein [Bacillus velezensis]
MKKKSTLKKKSRNKEKNTSEVKGLGLSEMSIDEANIKGATYETIEKLKELYKATGYPLNDEVEPHQVPIISLIKLYDQKVQQKEGLVNILDQLVRDLEGHQVSLRRIEKEQQSFQNLIQTLLDEDTAQRLIQETESKIQEEYSKTEALIK